ncbi:MAG: glycosyl hydrolase-related protein, partial [Acholeplasmataceae bacterium]|nr:glycosyl hydrolase-related protein [Acholeplasmataceae bacterium]
DNALNTMTFIKNLDASIEVSAIKKAYDENGYIIRLYNRTTKDQYVTLNFNETFKMITQTNMVEEPLEIVFDKNQNFTPFEVKTFRLA